MSTTKYPYRTVVRLSTNVYMRGDALVQERRIYTLKRKSIGYNVFEDDLEMIGTEVWNSIKDINNTPDGKYIIDMCNMSRDWESGTIDEWDLCLTPYTEEDE
jgi:hypothetical protein